MVIFFSMVSISGTDGGTDGGGTIRFDGLSLDNSTMLISWLHDYYRRRHLSRQLLPRVPNYYSAATHSQYHNCYYQSEHVCGVFSRESQ